MAGEIEQGIRLDDGHALGAVGDFDDLVPRPDFALLKHAKIEPWPAMGDEQSSHARFIHPDADAVARNPRLCYLEQGIPDPVAVADAHLIVGQAFDGEILAELAVSEVTTAELALPIVVGLDLIDHHRPVLTPVPRQIPLAVTVDVESPDHAPAGDRLLPYPGMDSPSAPRNVSWKTYID